MKGGGLWVPHNPDYRELSVHFEHFSEGVSEAEVLLIESCLGNLIQAVLLMQEEER
jgi:hypothetical protein